MIKNASSLKDNARNVAEKVQAVSERKLTNSRMKDYYDLYFFVHYKWNEIDKEILVEAIIKTFASRNSIIELKNISETIKSLQENQFLNKLWLNYREKHNYSKDINFENTIKAIEIIREEIFANEKIKKQVISI